MSFGTASFGAGPFGTVLPVGNLQVVNVVLPVLAALTPKQAIGFDVISKFDFRRILVFAEFTGKTPEMAHDGEQFAVGYAESTRVACGARCWRYSIKRSRGWPAAVAMRVYAFDVKGSEL